MYFNYKGFPSIVLMALCDADFCFLLIDYGQFGRISDAGVYQASPISLLLEDFVPKQTFKVNGSNTKIPYTAIWDEAFPFKTYLMKPFASRTLDAKRRIYNYRHSRARHTVECAFSILASKFENF